MNITFLQPSILWLAPLSLLPIVIHFLFRRKPNKIPFSYLRFIELAARNVSPRKKLYQILLLIVRCLLVLILCFAFARPAGYVGKSVKTEKNREIVFLLDSSLSMNYREAGRKRFSAAGDFILSLCSKITSGSKRTGTLTGISIVLCSDRIEKYAESMRDIGSIKKFLAECRAGYFKSDLLTGINFIFKMLSKITRADKTVIIISDMAEHAFPGGIEELKQRVENPDLEVAFIFVEVGQKSFENAFVKNANVHGSGRQIDAELSCFSEKTLNRFFITEINDKKIYQDEVNLMPDETLKKEIKYPELQFDLKPAKRMHLRAVLRLQEDALYEDDSNYAVVTYEPAKNILVVDGEPRMGYGINSESYYLKAALSEKISGRFNLKVAGPDELTADKNLSKYDVIVFCGVKSMPEEVLKTLESVTAPDIILFADGDLKPEFLPEWISENFAGEINRNKIYLSTFSLSQDEAGNFFPEINNFDVEKISFNGYWQLNETNSEVLLKFANGLPFLIKKTRGKANVYITASGIGKLSGNFPTKPFFPYFIQSLLGSPDLAQTIPVKRMLKTGEPIIYSAKTSHSAGVSVTLPDGSKKVAKRMGTEVIFEDTLTPGFYALNLPGDAEDKIDFAINPETSKGESNLKKIDSSLPGKIFPESSIVYVKWDKDALNKALSALEGVDLSGKFLSAVLMLLCIEIALVEKWRSKK